jgi:hypothetical protein
VKVECVGSEVVIVDRSFHEGLHVPVRTRGGSASAVGSRGQSVRCRLILSEPWRECGL